MLLALAVPWARAQDAPVSPPNPDGCTTPDANVAEAAQELLHVTSTLFDFKTIARLWPLTPESPDRQPVCVALKAKMPPEDAWRRVLLFESIDHYIGMTQLVDPDPTDDEIVSGLVTVAVFRKDLSRITAFSF